MLAATIGVSSSTSSSSTKATSSHSVTATSTHSATATPKTSHSNNSGAKIGIGVGVSLSVVAVLAVIGMFFWARRKARRSGGLMYNGKKQELDGSAKEIHEVDGTVDRQREVSLQDNGGSPTRQEQNAPVHEMDGSSALGSTGAEADREVDEVESREERTEERLIPDILRPGLR
jgi:hypothetical protein